MIPAARERPATESMATHMTTAGNPKRPRRAAARSAIRMLGAVAELETVVGRPRVAVRAVVRIGRIVRVVSVKRVVRINVDEGAAAMMWVRERYTAEGSAAETPP